MIKQHLKILADKTLHNAGDVAKFEAIAPRHCQRLLGICIFSPDFANAQASTIDVMTSISINNKRMFLGNDLVTLGYYDPDDRSDSRVEEMDEPLIEGQIIEGNIQCLTSNAKPFSVSVYLIYLKNTD